MTVNVVCWYPLNIIVVVLANRQSLVITHREYRLLRMELILKQYACMQKTNSLILNVVCWYPFNLVVSRRCLVAADGVTEQVLKGRKVEPYLSCP